MSIKALGRALPTLESGQIAAWLDAGQGAPVKPLISERMDGGENLFPRRPVRKAGLQKASGCGDAVGVGQQRPAGRTAVKVHLLLDDLPQVLHDMEPVSDLLRLRCPLSCSLGVETAPISADHFYFGMSLPPVGAGDDISILENVDDHATRLTQIVAPYPEAQSGHVLPDGPVTR